MPSTSRRPSSQRPSSPSSRRVTKAKSSRADSSSSRPSSSAGVGPLSDAEVIECLGKLGIEGSANLKQINGAWKKAALLSHPDKIHDGGEKFLEVQVAHDSLQTHAKDPQRVRAAHTDRRANFDRIQQIYEMKKERSRLGLPTDDLKAEAAKQQKPQTDRPGMRALRGGSPGGKAASPLALMDRPRSGSTARTARHSGLAAS